MQNPTRIEAHDAPLLAQIDAVARGSANYRDGVFHNREPSTPLSISRAEAWKLVHDMFGGDSAHPEIPIVVPDPAQPAADLALT